MIVPFLHMIFSRTSTHEVLLRPFTSLWMKSSVIASLTLRIMQASARIGLAVSKACRARSGNPSKSSKRLSAHLPLFRDLHKREGNAAAAHPSRISLQFSNAHGMSMRSEPRCGQASYAIAASMLAYVRLNGSHGSTHRARRSRAGAGSMSSFRMLLRWTDERCFLKLRWSGFYEHIPR